MTEVFAITELEPACGTRITKVIGHKDQATGYYPIQGYPDHLTWWRQRRVTIPATVQALFGYLREVRGRNACVIRDAHADPQQPLVRRWMADVDGRGRDGFDDVPTRYFGLDLDDVVSPWRADPIGAVREVRARLGAPFASTACVWSFSASHGLEIVAEKDAKHWTGRIIDGRMRLRLVFILDRPLGSAEAIALTQRAQERVAEVDAALCRRVQINYVLRPFWQAHPGCDVLGGITATIGVLTGTEWLAVPDGLLDLAPRAEAPEKPGPPIRLVDTGRRFTLDADARAVLRDYATEIVMTFRGAPNAKLSTSQTLRWGNKGSFKLDIAGPWAGRWHDFEAGEAGDMIALIRRERGCNFITALDYADQLVPGIYDPARRPKPRPAPIVVKKPIDIDAVLAIWAATQPRPGTLAERYLQRRSLYEVPASAHEVLRFHPRCPWGDGVTPAMVALIVDTMSNEPIGIHRTALTADGRKAEPPRIMGESAGGAIKLAAPYCAVGDDALGDELVIGEGIETTLSAMALGYTPAWSLIDAGGVGTFPPLPGVRQLTIIIDHDASGAGERAAAKTKASWELAGLRVRAIMPPTTGHDLNDVLKLKRMRALLDA